MLSRPVVELSRRLAGSLPAPLKKALLLSTGEESNEAAIRLTRLVTGGHEIVSFARSWHGMTQAAVGATYSAGRRGYGPAAPGNFAIPVPLENRADFVDADGHLELASPARPGLLAHRRTVHRRPRCLHRRADPQLGRGHRAAPRLPRRPQDQVRGARDAPHPRRGSDRALPDRAVGDVRGRGLLQGVELASDTLETDALGTAITRRCLALGLHMNIVQLPGVGGTFRIAPPLTSTEDETALGLEILDQAIGEVSAEQGAQR